MAADLIPVVDDGLGNTTWLVDLGDGRALAVDASRDLRGVQQAAQAVNAGPAQACRRGLLAAQLEVVLADSAQCRRRLSGGSGAAGAAGSLHAAARNAGQSSNSTIGVRASRDQPVP